MSEKENVEIMKNIYSHWNKNKEKAFQLWLDSMSEDIHFKSIGDGARGLEFSRPCRSKKQVIRYFEELAEDWEMRHYTIEDYIAQGDRVVAIGKCAWQNRNTQKIVDSPKVDIIRMKDGKIVEFLEFFDTAKAVAGATPD